MTESGEIQTRPTLARLTDEGRAIQQLLLDPEIEDRETLETALGNVQGAWVTKVENIGTLILDWRERIEAIKRETSRLQNAMRTLESRIGWLEGYTMSNMIASEDEDLQFPLVSVKVATNPPSVEIVDEKEVPASFLRIPVMQPEVNRNAILEHYRKTGREVKGVRIITDRKRLVVK